MVNVKTLLKKHNLTEVERRFLEGFQDLNDEKFQNAIRKAREAGKDPTDLILWALENKKK